MLTPQSRSPYLPARIEGLSALAMNLWWSWCREARALFQSIDVALWHHTGHNPLELLCRVEPARLAACASDSDFLRRYDAVMQRMEHEADHSDTWFARNYPDLNGRPVAYFCAEFGLHNSVPIYSGGLGVLAGDHCKSASDLGVPLVGVGLFYRKGYFDQRLSLEGWQEDSDEEYDVSATPLVPVMGSGRQPWLTTVQTSGRPVHVRAWQVMVGRVPIYLLDTNLDANHPDDRGLMNKLYAGGPELRVRQEWILGVGGVRVLRAMGIDPGVWHANEGHAGFMFIERLRELIVSGTPLDQAIEQVRAQSVFTTHTPVPAGHDAFPADQLEACTGPVWEEMNISRDQLLGLGAHPGHANQFHMTALAMRLSGRVNGVSRRHGQVTRNLWRDLWPNRPWEAVPVTHVTNGVHLATWMASPIMALLDEHLGPNWGDRLEEPSLWDQVLTLDHTQLWEAHLKQKRALANFIREDARRRFAGQLKEASQVVGAGTLLDPMAFTIGFARR
ncbi:MAG: alpha-glucan family phosphorylase, partial [Gemmatimonadales bacterium]